MRHLKQLSPKEVKTIVKKIEEQFGIKKLKLNYIFFKSNKDRIFLINEEINDIDKEKLRINSLGLYFARLDKKGIRLTIEGAQIIGPKATKNIYEMDEKEMNDWIRGYDLEVKEKFDKHVLLKKGKDFFGCGKYIEGKILNFVPKDRRVFKL